MGQNRTDAKLEADYQAGLVDRIEALFPGCFVRKHDIQQGWPDLLIIFGNKWAMLEVKPYASAKQQPNQAYWVDHFDSLSFAAFIYPENEEEVLHDLQQAFCPSRKPRLPVGK